MSGSSIAAVAVGFALIIATAVMIFRLRNVPQSPAVALTWRTTPIWVRTIWLLNLLNFFAFFFGVLRLGGDAGNGYHLGHQYFLGARGGSYIPVSRTVWLYSHYHLLSIWVLFFVAFLAVGWHVNRVNSSTA